MAGNENTTNAAVETIVDAEYKQEAEAVITELLSELDQNQVKEMISFAQGMRFASSIDKTNHSA